MNDKISWLSVKSLVRLEMRARFGSRVEMGTKERLGKAASLLFTLAIYAILVTGVYYLAEMFINRSGLELSLIHI